MISQWFWILWHFIWNATWKKWRWQASQSRERWVMCYFNSVEGPRWIYGFRQSQLSNCRFSSSFLFFPHKKPNACFSSHIYLLFWELVLQMYVTMDQEIYKTNRILGPFLTLRYSWICYSLFFLGGTVWPV